MRDLCLLKHMNKRNQLLSEDKSIEGLQACPSALQNIKPFHMNDISSYLERKASMGCYNNVPSAL
jgi:hypothetical protein